MKPAVSKREIRERTQAWLLIALGCVLGGAAYPLFLVPNNIAPGGLTGIATIFNYLWGWPVGTVSMILNLPLFLIGYKSMGRTFVFRSFVATILFSACIDLLNLPPLTEDILLGSVYGALLLGGFLVNLALEWSNPLTLGGMPFGEKLLAALEEILR